MTILAIIGVIIGAVALVLAVVAVIEGVPAVEWEAQGWDGFEIWNTGPRAVVITQLTVFAPDMLNGTALEDLVDDRVQVGEPYIAVGKTMPQAIRHPLTVLTNTSLKIGYRRTGLVGLMAKSTVTIHGSV